LRQAYLPGIWAAPVPAGSLGTTAGAGAGAPPVESGICAAAGACTGRTVPSSTLPEPGAVERRLPK